MKRPSAPVPEPPPRLLACPHPEGPIRVVGDWPTAGGPRALVPAHEGVSDPGAHTSLPRLRPGAWENAKHYPVVIVGAGIGGLYAAWRLQGCDGSQPTGQRIAIYERTAHTGGRIHTAKFRGNQHPMDIGAMRYAPQQHPLLQHLADHFQIETRKFVVNGHQNLNYFRGKRLTQAELAAHPDSAPYNLRPDERGKSSGQLLQGALKDAQVGHGQGLRNVLAQRLSQEAVQYVADASGYESDLQNWEAGAAIKELSGHDVEHVVPRDGMSAFHKNLQNDLSRARTDISTDKTLRQLNYDPASAKFQLLFESGGGAVPVTADKVILNLPKAPLAQVVADSPFLHGTPLDKNLDKVQANGLTRIFAAYDRPWWNELGIEGGRSVTDLNLGQVYYYGGKDDARPFLEVYNDGAKAEFWHSLQNPDQPGASVALSVKPQLAAEMQRQLEELHGRSLPQPTGYLYKNWNDPFFGGGWHTWNPGSRPEETAASMLQPLENVPLYVCGEAYSTSQGWIEGALQTSESVLQKLGKAPLLAQEK